MQIIPPLPDLLTATITLILSSSVSIHPTKNSYSSAGGTLIQAFGAKAVVYVAMARTTVKNSGDSLSKPASRACRWLGGCKRGTSCQSCKLRWKVVRSVDSGTKGRFKGTYIVDIDMLKVQS
jgi:hypothetical protein